MPSRPVSETFDPFIAAIARSTAALVLGSLKPELLRATPAPNDVKLLNEEAVVGHNGPPIDDDVVLTVEEFCKRYRISRSNLYKMWEAGVGPRFFLAGTAVRITGRAGREWLDEREAAAAAEPAE